MRFFVGDDWAEDHHDVEVMDERGGCWRGGGCPRGVAGMAGFHELIGKCLGEDPDDAEVVIGTETDRGPWVRALAAAGYMVYGVNPLQASRFRARHAVSGAKSDAGDAHMLADMVRTDSHQLRAVAGDTAGAEGLKALARMRKTLIWERTRQVQRLRHQLLGYFPGALDAFGDDLAAPDHLELLGRAPDPARAAALTRAQVSAALRRRPLEDHRPGDRDPGRAARGAAGPAAGRDRRLRRHRPGPDRGDHRPERAGQDPARAGGGEFWAAPGR